MEYPVQTIRRRDLDEFQGQYAGSTSWLNIDHEWSKRKCSILEPDFYYKKLKGIFKVKISKHIKLL